MAALAIEKALAAANVFSDPLAFRGRVNAYADPTGWGGTILVQRRFVKIDASHSSWVTIQTLDPGDILANIIEHEDGVEYRMGSGSGFTGATFVRLSQ